MGESSKIGWTDATWNPVIGCSHVSAGCEHCYAETLALRRGWTPAPWTAPNAVLNVQLKPNRLGEPLKWRKPRRVFVNSMSDLFHPVIPDSYIAEVFAVMALASAHTFQVLTKRPERMFALVNDPAFVEHVDGAIARHGFVCACECDEWPLKNVWLGVSVENQRAADDRIPWLVQTEAAVRFLSCEPLLSEVRLATWLDVGLQTWREPGRDSLDGWRVVAHPTTGLTAWRPGIDWVIVGGESGPGYRPMDPAWARSLRDECAAADVAFFYKQGAGPRPAMDPELDGARHEAFPEAAHA